MVSYIGFMIGVIVGIALSAAVPQLPNNLRNAVNNYRKQQAEKAKIKAPKDRRDHTPPPTPIVQSKPKFKPGDVGGYVDLT